MTPAFTHDQAGTPAAGWHSDPRRAGVVEVDPARYSRLVVVAAHPDDESLGAAGLAARAVRAGVAVDLVVVTSGEHSHPGSPTMTPQDLALRRREESRTAWQLLGTDSEPHVLDVEDGAVAASVPEVTAALVALLGDARDTLVAAPWRTDGHPDHEATGRAAAAACRRTGADLLEYPIWFWHWAQPDEAPWDDMVGVPLSPEDVDRKHRAISAHRSQVEPLSSEPGDETLLGPAFLALFAESTELFVRQPAVDSALDDLHGEQPEPWGADERWYEERKRALTVAALPRARYRRGLEVGCSTGVLSAALAERCDELVAVDSSPAAVGRAAERLAHLDVRAEVLDLPDQWPEGAFDLVVISEVGYFLSPLALEKLAARVNGSLTDGGCVVLCHWRHEVDGWPLDGPQVHERMIDLLDVPVAARYADRDVEILVLAEVTVLPDPAT